MKTQEEIDEVYKKLYLSLDDSPHYHTWVRGYTQCQEDMTLQGKCLSGKTYDDCHIHSSNIFGCLSCGNFERNKQD